MVGFDYKPCCRCGMWVWKTFSTWPNDEIMCWSCFLKPDDGERVDPIQNLPKENQHAGQMGRILSANCD